jgi:uncharacterized membrane protein YgaE (UPF0421/DUF939 family)
MLKPNKSKIGGKSSYSAQKSIGSAKLVGKLAMQSRFGSIIETLTNVVVGLIISFVANLLIFPLFGWEISTSQNIILVIFYTVISIVRSYALRRIFNKIKSL